MKDRRVFTGAAALIVALLLFTNAFAADKVADGKKVYIAYCVGCHGVKNDGNGPAAKDLLVKPRNLTLGIFKFKSTNIGAMPSDDDLIKTITHGLPPSSMPSFRLLPDQEKTALVAYIKSLSPRWGQVKETVQYATAKTPDFVGTADSVAKGARLFADNCAMCHGKEGHRQNVSFILNWDGSKEPKDMVRPANFRYGTIKRGPTVYDIYLSMTAGVEGTPMPSFAEFLSDTDRWNITSYILQLMGKFGGKKNG